MNNLICLLPRIVSCIVTIVGGSHAAEAIRPNIVLVVSDDQGYGDASCYWNTDLQTPVMDAVAQRGIRFMQFRVNPLCAPTRASLMTGLYSLEAGMWRGPGMLERGPEPEEGWPSDARRIRDEVLLLPQYLKRAGYATGLFGKWHLGYDPNNVPNARGFDEFVGFLGGAHPYWPRGASQLQRNGQRLQTDKHTTDLFADEAIRFIHENAARPFFCYVPFNAVHGPLRNAERPRDSGRPEWLARYEAAGVVQPRRDYCAVMSHADARVGDILAALRELGLERRTLVIYLSDNGGILDKYPSNNGPFRGGKGQTYEGGIRVPAVMQWPAVIPAGTVSRADAVHFDIFATILDAAAVAIPKKNGGYAVNGQSLLSHLRSGAKTGLPDRYLFWDLYGKQAALHGAWKLIGELPNHRGDFRRAVADAASADFKLYNMKTDPSEQRDLAAERPDIYTNLKRRHIEWLGAIAVKETEGERPTGRFNLDISTSPRRNASRRNRCRFTKQVEVFGLHIYATNTTGNDKLLHAANILAEYIDNDEDGTPDNPMIMKALIAGKGAIVMKKTEEERPTGPRPSGQGLYDEETIPNGRAQGRFDASLEEILHMVSDVGWAGAYPDVFAREPGTAISNGCNQLGAHSNLLF